MEVSAGVHLGFCLARWMSPNFYVVYILHMPIIVAVATPFLSIALPTPIKFFLVGALSIASCFILGNLVRKKTVYEKGAGLGEICPTTENA